MTELLPHHAPPGMWQASTLPWILWKNETG